MAQSDFTMVAIAPLMDELCEAVDAARVRAGNDSRWQNAIDTGWGWLLQQDAVSYDHAAHALRVESASEAGKTYVSNGDCQCRAFTEHNACWHRAASRLLRRALELRAMAEAHDLAVEAEERRAAERYYAEIDSLAAELYAAAQAAGDTWYDRDIAQSAAEDRYSGLMVYAAEWDEHSDMIRAAVAESRAHLAAVA